MKKALYNIASIIVAVALVGFMSYCWNEYVRFGLMENLMYVIMGAISVVAVLANLAIGGRKNEAKH